MCLSLFLGSLHNMSIYRRLYPKLLVQVGIGLELLYWTNMSKIFLIGT